jgi:type II secretory pathway component GspD/PulD (secretin)
MGSRVLKSKKDFRTLYDEKHGSGGNVAGTGVSGNATSGGFTKQVLTFKNTPIVLADNAGVVAYGSLKILDFPQGSVIIEGATANLVVTKTSAGVNATWNGDFGVGTAAADNTNTLSSTEQNIIPTTPTPAAVAGVTSAKGRSTASVTLDGTTTAVDAYINFLVDDANQDVTTTPCNLILNGTVTILWANMGDY